MTNVIDNDNREDPGQAGPSEPSESPLRIVRARDGWAGGVCSGLAVTARVDVVLVRLAFVLAATSGLGVLVYVALWIFAPCAGDEDVPDPAPASHTHATVIRWILLIAAVVGGFSGLWYLGFADDDGVLIDPFPFDSVGGLMGAGLVALGVAWFVRRDREQAAGDTGSTATEPSSPTPPVPLPAPSTSSANPPSEHPTAGPEAPSDRVPAVSVDATGGMSPPPSASEPSEPSARPAPPGRTGDTSRWSSLAAAVFAWLGILVVLAVHLVVGVLVSVEVVSIPAAMVLNVVAVAAVVAMVVSASRRRDVWLYGTGVLVLAGLAAIVVASGSFNGKTGRTVFTVSHSGELSGDYRNALGHLTVDLSAVDFGDPGVASSLTVEGGIGRLDVIVPDDVELVAEYHLQGGEFVLDGRSVSGWDVDGARTLEVEPSGGAGEFPPRPTTSPAVLDLDVDMVFGQAFVCRAADADPHADQCRSAP